MSVTARIIPFPERRQRLVDLRELQELFGMSERWYRYAIADGMPVHRWGRRLKFDPVEVQEWVEARSAKAYDDARRRAKRRTHG